MKPTANVLPRPARCTVGVLVVVASLGACSSEPHEAEPSDRPAWREAEARPEETRPAPTVWPGSPFAKEPRRRLTPEQVSRLAVPFVPNGGQWSDEVAFKADHFAGTFWVTRDGALVVSLLGPEVEGSALEEGDDGSAPRVPFAPPEAPGAATRVVQGEGEGPSSTGAPFVPGARQPRPRAPGWTLVERFVGGGPSVPRGIDEAPTQVSYFLGDDPTKWVSGADTYGAVSLGEVWPGIEVRLAARGNNVEKLFYVAPHEDPSRIEMELEGALAWRLSDEGALVVSTGHGDVELSPPVAFQDVGGERREVDVRYAATSRGYRFVLGAYDRDAELVIDPLLQSTYVGGAGDDFSTYALLAADDGSVLVAGTSTSTDYPGTSGGAQPGAGGAIDVVVSRLSGDLRTLLQSTYLGGSETDEVYAMALTTTGDVLVTGYSDSTNYPGTSGGAQPSSRGSWDIVVSRLSGDLTLLQRSTYLGGASVDQALALAVDDAGDVIVVGRSLSTNYPGMVGSAQPTSAGNYDVVISRLNGDLTTLQQSTYLGGSNEDHAFAVALDSDGSILVAGNSASTDYPGTAGGAQPSIGGPRDIVVSRLSGDLAALQQSTYLGGSDGDYAYALALDATGRVLVAGSSYSADYPGVQGGSQASFGGGATDIVVSRLSGDLTTLQRSTYLGGTGRESAFAVALDSGGSVLVTGQSDSTNYPGTVGGVQQSSAGGYDAVISRLSGDLTTLQQSTYLGGAANDYPKALALNPAGQVLVAGYTFSANYPGTSGGAQPDLAGGFDAIVTRLTADLRRQGCGDGILDPGEECDLAAVGDAQCPAGYEGERRCNNDPDVAAGDGTCTLAAADLTCSDVDECGAGTDNCDVNASCTNTAGSFSCTCDPGFEGDGTSCSDIDECATNNGGCDALTSCTNTPGGRTCGACPAGYAGNGENGCVDIDECATGADDCDANATCSNTPGAFTCTCNEGYAGDGVTCADVAPPDTALDTMTGAVTTERAATFHFTGSEPGCTFECSLDDAPFAACASPHEYVELDEGPHAFRVRATDAAGNVDPTPAVHLWVIEAAPPEPFCGDGDIEVPEACDDGNTEAGDGCDAACAIEEGYACEGEPSMCEKNRPPDGGEPEDKEPQAPAEGCGCDASRQPDVTLAGLGLALLLARRRRGTTRSDR